jgi:hypothetical protein
MTTKETKRVMELFLARPRRVPGTPTPRQVLRRLGVDVVRVGADPDLLYDGEKFYFPDYLCKPRREPDLWHEVAHYQVASPEGRGQANFGLGSSPFCRVNSKPTRSGGIADDEESLASALGICWARARGYRLVVDILHDHNWVWAPEREDPTEWGYFHSTLQELQTRSLIDNNYLPRIP